MCKATPWSAVFSRGLRSRPISSGQTTRSQKGALGNAATRKTSPHPPLALCGDVEMNPGPCSDPYSDLDPQENYDLLCGSDGEGHLPDPIKAPPLSKEAAKNFEVEVRIMGIMFDIIDGLEERGFFQASLKKADRNDPKFLASLKDFLCHDEAGRSWKTACKRQTHPKILRTFLPPEWERFGSPMKGK